MSTPIVIVGAGGFGRELLDVIEAVNVLQPTWDFLGFLDDKDPDEDLLGRRGAKHLGSSEELANLDADYVIGIGSGEVRNRIDALATSAGRRPATLVHPSATVGSDVELGEGTVVCGQVSITTHVRLGRHVQVNPGCTLGHDVVLEDNVTLLPGAAISGNVLLREGVTVGARAVVLQGLEVGAGSMIGAGAVVVRSVLAGSTVVGVPAQPLRPGRP
jgi:sugar O-acyltransferase (sialic acid O-acetyltransferase NeuD family)